MTRVGFIMRAHPRDEGACLVGGAAKNPFRMLRALRRRVAVAGVLVVDDPGRFISHGYPVQGVRLPGLKLYARTVAWNLAMLPATFRLFARADVVQCHHPNFGLGAAIARRWFFRGVPLVVKAHGTGTPEFAANRYLGIRGRILALNAALHRRHDRWVLANADLCLVSSDFQVAEMEEIYGVDRDRVRRIYNGVDAAYLRVRRRSGADAALAPRLLFVGRVVPKKGLRQLRSMFAELLERCPDARLALVLGHRDRVDDRSTLRFVQEEFAALPGCTLHFDLDEASLFELMAESDIGLVPSEHYESIPTVVLEMCAAGLPVFATWRWGIPEVLPEDFGLTGDVTSDVRRLAAFVDTELVDWDSSGWASSYERFHHDRLEHQYREVYEELLERAGA